MLFRSKKKHSSKQKHPARETLEQKKERLAHTKFTHHAVSRWKERAAEYSLRDLHRDIRRNIKGANYDRAPDTCIVFGEITTYVLSFDGMVITIYKHHPFSHKLLISKKRVKDLYKKTRLIPKKKTY